jgi:potassium-transporting ATPase KdpC subunit
MSTIRVQLLAALRAILVLTVVTGILYPLAVTVVAQLAFEDEADGSLVLRDGEVVGSALLGQSFTAPEYFHSRPSAAGAAASGTAGADPDDLTQVASGASNLGPTNPDLLAAVDQAAVAYREANRLDADTPVPVDAVTSSASGVDPHISVANARLQAARVAGARALDLQVVEDLIEDHTDGRTLGFLGEPGVDVLALNLALDQLEDAAA